MLSEVAIALVSYTDPRLMEDILKAYPMSPYNQAYALRKKSQPERYSFCSSFRRPEKITLSPINTRSALFPVLDCLCTKVESVRQVQSVERDIQQIFHVLLARYHPIFMNPIR